MIFELQPLAFAKGFFIYCIFEEIVSTEVQKLSKPFLKWAGGKTQLINTIKTFLPKDFNSREITYVEPFVGSGAIMFWFLNNYPNIKKAVINDINADLINVYKVIASQPKELITLLHQFQNEYYELSNIAEKKKEYYYNKRDRYNHRSENDVTQAALFIFLNRTCFNGLYRVNKKNFFNVPVGSYKKPLICDEENILAVNKTLQKVEILNDDFENTRLYASENSFFYFDPPYKPISNTSSFNSYSKEEFNDNEQIRLRDFCRGLDEAGAQWLLSNSDVKDKESGICFFDTIYTDYYISRVQANRNINANPLKRGKLNELLISNYSREKALSVA